MVRYRNGQIVSTKGERYSEAKSAMTDEMKKTYINLKPAKQYRFHWYEVSLMKTDDTDHPLLIGSYVKLCAHSWGRTTNSFDIWL